MFLDVLRHQFQVSKSKIYKRKRKRTLINVQKSSTTLNLPFSGVQGANSKSPSLKSTKRKEKNINKCSYIIKKSSTTLNLPFPGVMGANSKSPSPKSTKRKEKNINKCSYIIKKLHHSQFTFSRSLGRQFQGFKSEIYKKKGKER